MPFRTLAVEWNDTGIVIAKGLFKEADLWLRILFREHGLATAFAFGGARSRRRFVGCLDVMNLIAARVKQPRENAYLGLEEAQLLRGPRRRREDPKRAGMAANCIKFLDALGLPEGSAGEGFALADEMLARLELPEPPGFLFPYSFRLRLAGLLGYAPDFETCADCGAVPAGPAVFYPRDGRVLCPACAGRRREAGVALSRAGLDVLAIVQQNYPLSWPADDLPAAERRKLAQAIDGFVEFYLGYTWDRGRFSRALRRGPSEGDASSCSFKT